jgi:hypothetical protein
MNAYELYVLYRKTKDLFDRKSYITKKVIIPKTFPKSMKESTIKKYEKLSGLFKTRWTSINPKEYFEAGFEYRKTFSPDNFFDEEVMKIYIANDKSKKRRLKSSKEALVKTGKFIMDFLKDKEYKGFLPLQFYCNCKEGKQKIIISHYLKNEVDGLFIVYCIKKDYLKLTDEEREKIPHIVDNFNAARKELKELEGFIEKIEDLIV